MIIRDSKDFPIYAFFIIVSLLIFILFNYSYLKKNKIERDKNILFCMSLFFFSIFFGKILTAIVDSSNSNIILAPLSSYGCAIGVLILTAFFLILSENIIYLKSVSLGLPLTYSIAKLACFFAGCCHGISYNGVFGVKYEIYNYNSFVPVQLMETITFMMIFLIGLYLDSRVKHKYSVEIIALLCAVGKFLLDYLRYSHVNQFLSVNQYISIFFALLFLAVIVVRIIRGKKEENEYVI